MEVAPYPVNESARIARLRLLNILDTEPEERFDRLTRIARKMFAVPIAQITLIDSDRQWFKSGADGDVRETPREVSFCAHAILGQEILHVSDASRDPRFSDNPLVMNAPKIRFYAGCPLKVGEENLGTLCLIGDEPRALDADERALLKDLAAMAEQELLALQLATTDELTTLSNRRGFAVLAEHTLRICKRMDKPATLLYLDLNRFKAINDTFGHAEGDRALRLFAESLIEVLRDSDVIGRLGGDEFAALLTGAESLNVPGILARLRATLRSTSQSKGLEYEVGFSAGQVEFDPSRDDSIQQLLAHADSAMYRSRENRAER